MKEEIFQKDSASEFGTAMWSMNVLGTTNAKKGPHKAYNAYKEYSDKELNAQIVEMTMTYFGMKDYAASASQFSKN